MTEEVEKTRQISKSERCDRCGAEAFVLAQGIDGELFFCGHHFAKHEKQIRSFAANIIDEREFLR